MTDREKLVQLIDEVAEGTIYESAGEQRVSTNSDDIADHLLANGVRIVVCCDDCVSRETCVFADMFRLMSMEKQFCAFGDKRSEQQ